MRRAPETGMTLIEIVISLGILALLAGVTLRGLSSANTGKALDTDALKIQGELAVARSLTLASKYADQWGVRFATTSLTLFEGSSFPVGSASNTVTYLNSRVQVASIAL